MTILLRACPRCAGDMHAAADAYGPYNKCVQCGYTYDLPTYPPVALSPEAVEQLAHRPVPKAA